MYRQHCTAAVAAAAAGEKRRSKSESQLRRAVVRAEKRRLADLVEHERHARRSAEKAAGLGAESLSLEVWRRTWWRKL